MIAAYRFRVCAWLFVAIAGMSLLSPVTAVDDELMHLGAIWCANGVDDEQCIALVENSAKITQDVLMPRSDLLGADSTLSATTNIDFSQCTRAPNEVYNCPTSQIGVSTLLVSNDALFQGWTYKLMHFMVSDDVEKSVIRIRLLTVLVSCLVFLGLLYLPNPRMGTKVLGAMIVCMQPFGWFLVSSVNPSGLATLGVATSWIFAHSFLEDNHISVLSRVRSGLLTIFTGCLAIGTRLDAAAFLLLTYAGLFAVIVGRRRRLIGGKFPWLSVTAGSVLVVAVCALALRTIHVNEIFARLIEEGDTGVPATTFFSHNLLQVLPIWFQATGSVSTHSGVVVPQAVSLVMTLLLGTLVASHLRRPNIDQIIGVLISIGGALLVNTLWTGVFDSRTLFGPSVRYTFPLLVFCTVWIVVFSSREIGPWSHVSRRMLELAYLFSFALTVYTIAERFTNRQSFGLRTVPEGLDDWWWSWIPIGPNVVVVSSVYCMFRAISSFRRIDSASHAE